VKISGALRIVHGGCLRHPRMTARRRRITTGLPRTILTVVRRLALKCLPDTVDPRGPKAK